jgi:3,2-trans-enoyl-CoA isomerase
MEFVEISKNNGVATIRLNRGKVNAINETVVDQLRQSLNELEKDETVDSLILTGTGKFFSFGFDIPEFLGFAREDFARFLIKFTDLYAYLFLYPKPVIAALNGHTIAGGCMLANACDYRIMVSGKAKISLNEITFGASVFARSVEILKYCVGAKNAQRVLFNGEMFTADQALELGLIDQISTEDRLSEDAVQAAGNLAAGDKAAFGSIKLLLRKPVITDLTNSEKKSIENFLDIWYSESTWKKLQDIKIHS